MKAGMDALSTTQVPVHTSSRERSGRRTHAALPGNTVEGARTWRVTHRRPPKSSTSYAWRRLLQRACKQARTSAPPQCAAWASAHAGEPLVCRHRAGRCALVARGGGCKRVALLSALDRALLGSVHPAAQLVAEEERRAFGCWIKLGPNAGYMEPCLNMGPCACVLTNTLMAQPFLGQGGASFRKRVGAPAAASRHTGPRLCAEWPGGWRLRLGLRRQDRFVMHLHITAQRLSWLVAGGC